MEIYLVSISIWVLYYIIANEFGLRSATQNEDLVSSDDETDTLVLVHVLFRHGNRTVNGPEELYPKDPYLNETYFPYGLGQLTNVGKIREYSIGTDLRSRYNTFLGQRFHQEMVDALSTDYNRTKASLQLVLAGLFPPNRDEMVIEGLNWQPIPYNYVPTSKDKLLIGVNCPNYKKLYNEYIQSLQEQDEFEKYKQIYSYISNNTGLNITTHLDVYNLYFGLSTEEEWGFELPVWTKSVWPEKITDLAIQYYFHETATRELKQMASGYFLQKFKSDTNDKIENSDNRRKIYLYSGHENNIADLLIILGVFEPLHVPDYGSYLVFEIHNINDQYGVKIYYKNYIHDELQLLKLPTCETFCELEKFYTLIEEYMPSNNLCQPTETVEGCL